jgi:hypothetical protein
MVGLAAFARVQSLLSNQGSVEGGLSFLISAAAFLTALNLGATPPAAPAGRSPSGSPPAIVPPGHE